MSIDKEKAIKAIEDILSRRVGAPVKIKVEGLT